jgi:PAS domain S-box-containing protein
MNSQEYVLNDHDIIVTKTDMQGVITYVSEDLLRITGFTRQEVIGQKHNIFRHPDMPAEVFSDLWRTILNQSTWRGTVKNKTKNGNFYWVQADVTPLYENDFLIGFMSVRRKIDINDIKKAEKAYAQMKAGTFKGQLSYGEIQEDYLLPTLKRKVNNLSIGTKLGILLGLNVFVILCLELVHYDNLTRLNDAHLKVLNQIQSYSNNVNVAHAQQHQLDQQHSLNNYLNQAVKKTKEEVKLSDYFYQAKTSLNQGLLDLESKNMFIVFTVLVLLILLSEIIIRSIVIPLKEATRTLMKISSGNYYVPVEHRSKSEVGRLIDSLRATSVRLGFDIANERKVADELTRLKVGLDNLSTGIAVADNNREIIYVNPAAFNLFKSVEKELGLAIPTFDMTQVIGRKIEEFHSNPAYQMNLLTNLKKTTRFEMRLADQIIVVNATPVINALEYRVGLVAEFENITERENNKAQLLTTIAQNQELNHRVNQMQKLESISRLTSGIAHDFNNILAAIIGYNQLNMLVVDDCQDAQLKEEIRFNTEQVGVASDRAADLIKKMMAYSRQNPTNKEMDVKPTKEVIEEVLALMRPALTSSFQIHTDIDSDLDIQIDSTGLHQILTNLFVNARDAMKQRGGIITVSLKKIMTHELICSACIRSLQGQFIELRVSDTGTGIDQKVMDHIFDPFFTTKKVGEGTGLGLSTVSGMVHDVHGHIIVESETAVPNHGTAFRLLFLLKSSVPSI